MKRPSLPSLPGHRWTTDYDLLLLRFPLSSFSLLLWLAIFIGRNDTPFYVQLFCLGGSSEYHLSRIHFTCAYGGAPVRPSLIERSWKIASVGTSTETTTTHHTTSTSSSHSCGAFISWRTSHCSSIPPTLYQGRRVKSARSYSRSVPKTTSSSQSQRIEKPTFTKIYFYILEMPELFQLIFSIF